MSVEKLDTGVCESCPMDAAFKATGEIIENNPKLYEGNSSEVARGALLLEEQILIALAKRLDCQGPKINQHNQHVCSLAAVFNTTVDTVGGPNGRVKGSMRFDALVHGEKEEKNGQYL